MNATQNSVPRKQLGDQIDRLDNILDGLADGLNGAITDAVRVAVQQAVCEGVQTAIVELLRHPEIIQSMAPQTPPTPTAAPEAAPAPPPSNSSDHPSLLDALQVTFWRSVSWTGEQLGRLSGYVQPMLAAVVTAGGWLLQPVIATTLSRCAVLAVSALPSLFGWRTITALG